MKRSIILLVSAQPMPNLLSAIDSELGVTNAHLIVSNKMRSQANALADILQQRGIQAEQHQIGNPFDVIDIRDTVKRIVDSDPSRFIVNVTGGTKTMALGAYRAAIEAGVRDIIYMDHKETRLHWLEGNHAVMPCHFTLRTEEILNAHGIRITGQETPGNAHIKAAEELFHILGNERLLSDWNATFQEIRREANGGKKWPSPPVPINRVTGNESKRTEGLHRALSVATRYDLCDVTDDQIIVHNRGNWQFLGGGWFEVVVYSALHQLRGQLGIDELMLNVTIEKTEAGKEGPGNELDVLARRQDRLFVVEVKTAKFGGKNGLDPNGVFFRLNSLGKDFGLRAGTALVARTKISLAKAERFKDGGVHSITDKDAAPGVLAGSLSDWIGMPR